MATCPVRFEFYCGEEELKYVHNVPRNLVTVRAQAARKEAGYANLFMTTLQPIIKKNMKRPVSPIRIPSAKIVARPE